MLHCGMFTLSYLFHHRGQDLQRILMGTATGIVASQQEGHVELALG